MIKTGKEMEVYIRIRKWDGDGELEVLVDGQGPFVHTNLEEFADALEMPLRYFINLPDDPEAISVAYDIRAVRQGSPDTQGVFNISAEVE